jgi:hypothetical protein
MFCSFIVDIDYLKFELPNFIKKEWREYIFSKKKLGLPGERPPSAVS